MVINHEYLRLFRENAAQGSYSVLPVDGFQLHSFLIKRKINLSSNSDLDWAAKLLLPNTQKVMRISNSVRADLEYVRLAKEKKLPFIVRILIFAVTPGYESMRYSIGYYKDEHYYRYQDTDIAFKESKKREGIIGVVFIPDNEQIAFAIIDEDQQFNRDLDLNNKPVEGNPKYRFHTIHDIDRNITNNGSYKGMIIR